MFPLQLLYKPGDGGKDDGDGGKDDGDEDA